MLSIVSLQNVMVVMAISLGMFVPSYHSRRAAQGVPAVLICLITCNLIVLSNCCTSSEFTCVKGTPACIKIEYKCDGSGDCDDVSDEANCTTEVTCPESSYLCADNTCSTLLDGCNDTQTATASVSNLSIEPEHSSTNNYDSSATTQFLLITETSMLDVKTTTDTPIAHSQILTNTPTAGQQTTTYTSTTSTDALTTGTPTTPYKSTTTAKTSIGQTTSDPPTTTPTDTSTTVSQTITKFSTSGSTTTDSQTSDLLSTTFTTTDVTVSITPTIGDLPDETNDRDTAFLRIFIPVAAVVISSILIISLYVCLKQRKPRTSTPDKGSCQSSVELSDISDPSENSDYHQLLKISSFDKRLYMYEVEWIRYMNKEYMTGQDHKYQNENSKEYMTGQGQKYQNEYSKQYMTGKDHKYQNENSKQYTTGQDQK